MIKLIAVSVFLMSIGCSITDKIEECMNAKRTGQKNICNGDSIDLETLNILKNYDLISDDQYNYDLSKLNKV